MEPQNQDIMERIHAAYYHLTVSERKVADHVLNHASQVQFMSITQLADECNVAEATVSRFCRSLKLGGFNAFKLEIAKHIASSASASREEDPEVPEGRFQRVSRLACDAVRQTVEMADPAQLSRAVALLENAPRVLCYGSGGSMIMASECAHLFSTVTGKFHAISDSHAQMSATATMEQADVIVLFSYSGATNEGIQVLQLAKSRGIHTILVTRFAKSPAAKLASVVLRCGSNEGPFQFGSIPAKIAQLTIVDLLFQEYCHRNREACQDSVRRVADALSGKHL